MKKLAFFLLVGFTFSIPWEESLVLIDLGTASKIAGLTTAAVWLVSIVISRSSRRPEFFHIAALAFFAWSAASVLWSVDPELTLGRVRTYTQTGIMILLVWDLCREDSDVRILFQAYVIGAWISILSTVFNYLSGIEATFGRYSPSGFNPNTGALLIVLGIPIAWHLATTAEGILFERLKFLNFLYVPAAMFAIFLTGTRFALLASIPGILFALGTTGRIQPRYRVLVLVFLLGALVALPFWIPLTSLERLSTTGEELTEGSLSGRTQVWREGIEVLSRRPLFGVGSAAFPTVVPSGRAAHNSFLAVLVEVGVVGLLLFVVVLSSLVESMTRLSVRDRSMALALVLTWVVGNFALTWEHKKATWLLFGLLVTWAGARRHLTRWRHGTLE